MKIILFGATGRTGREILRQGVEQGHSITAFVRNRGALEAGGAGDSAGPIPGRTIDRIAGQVRVIEGDLFDPAAVAEAIAGHSAVLSALGARTLKRIDLLGRALPNIIAGMQRQYVARLIVVGAAGAQKGYGKYQSALTRFLFALGTSVILRAPFADQRAQERILAASAIDYTIVRPPRLVDGPLTRKYRVLPDALPPGGLRISRADVADFMLQQLTDPRFHRQGPYIAD